jgi:hypothetical protein|tara:strand:- start:1598 stop:1999 length:402 start_codon:yes stop_codon:yes gene_type:complete
MALVLLCASTYVAYKLLYKEYSPPERADTLKDLKLKVHKYSGVEPEIYMKFLSKIKLAQRLEHNPNVAQQYLIESLDSLEDLGLYGETRNLGIQDEIHQLSNTIGYTFEKKLMDNAINNNEVFHPKYLNRRIY